MAPTGPNLEALRELTAAVSIPVIASGGVSSITDLLSLLALEPLGVTGVLSVVPSHGIPSKMHSKRLVRAFTGYPSDLGFSAFA